MKRTDYISWNEYFMGVAVLADNIPFDKLLFSIVCDGVGADRNEAKGLVKGECGGIPVFYEKDWLLLLSVILADFSVMF